MALLSPSIRHKIDTGILPCARPNTVLAGNGDGSTCTACDMPIPPTQVEWSFWRDDICAHRLHIDCHGLWKDECGLRGWRMS